MNISQQAYSRQFRPKIGRSSQKIYQAGFTNGGFKILQITFHVGRPK